MKMYDICRGLGLFKRPKDGKNTKDKGKDPKGREKNKPAQNKSSGKDSEVTQEELSYVSSRAFDPWNLKMLDLVDDSQHSGVRISPPEERPCAFTYLPSVSVENKETKTGGSPPRGYDVDTCESVTVSEQTGQGLVMMRCGGSGSTSGTLLNTSFKSHSTTLSPSFSCYSSENESCSRSSVAIRKTGGARSKDGGSDIGFHDDALMSLCSSQSLRRGIGNLTDTYTTSPKPGKGDDLGKAPRARHRCTADNSDHLMDKYKELDLLNDQGGLSDPAQDGRRREVVKRSATMAAAGDCKQWEKNGRQPRRFSCIERNRYLENKIIPHPSTSLRRSSRRDSDRKRPEDHPVNSPQNHQPRQNQDQHHPHPQHRRSGARPLRSSSTRNPERRKTLGSLDAKEVTMLTRASKALQDHVKDMTEKTKTTCCVVNNKLAEKENLISNGAPHPEPHHYITDHSRETTYLRGRLLGKGGFAKCYELTDVQTGKCYAGKIISKNRLSKPHQREKIAREVELHRRLKHAHVVGFHSYFEDNDNVYIVLEYCSRKSLVHVLKNRKTVTETEVRFYLKQLIEGCQYIHSQRIIHRDLKLGNMLLNEDMQIKIADFGLATRVEYDGEKKMTVCGTPNYIAPEVLQKQGHSYEADIWAMGCVMYALLLGRPPFETTTLKETYVRITSNNYSIPNRVSPAARNLIQSLLTNDPLQRPSLEKILQHEFFTGYVCPTSLPTSACDVPPKIQQLTQQQQPQQQRQQHHHQLQQQQQERPKSYAAPVSATEAMQKITSSLAQLRPSQQQGQPLLDNNNVRGRPRSPSPLGRAPVRAVPPVQNHNIPTRNPPTAVNRPSSTGSTGSSTGSEGSSSYGSRSSRPNSTEIKALPIGSSIRLYQLLASCLEQMPDDSNPSAVHNVKPLWVTKWVDYSNKYGFGFQLSDRSVGVLFNDTTRMLLSPESDLIYYNDLSNKVYRFGSNGPPREYEKKSTLLKYFAQYMDEHLIHGGDLVAQRSTAAPAPSPAGIPASSCNSIFMKKWFRTGKAIVMYLNNGTLQVNFFEDHTKVILSPEGQDYLVTYINTHRQAVTYRLLQFRHFGCNADIQERLQYARTMLESIINIEGEAV